jgi:hypothetical protein
VRLTLQPDLIQVVEISSVDELAILFREGQNPGRYRLAAGADINWTTSLISNGVYGFALSFDANELVEFINGEDVLIPGEELDFFKAIFDKTLPEITFTVDGFDGTETRFNIVDVAIEEYTPSEEDVVARLKTLVDVMAEDFEVWVGKNQLSGFVMDITDENGIAPTKNTFTHTPWKA